MLNVLNYLLYLHVAFAQSAYLLSASVHPKQLSTSWGMFLSDLLDVLLLLQQVFIAVEESNLWLFGLLCTISLKSTI